MKIQGLERRKVTDLRCRSRVQACGNRLGQLEKAVGCAVLHKSVSKGKVRWWLDRR